MFRRFTLTALSCFIGTTLASQIPVSTASALMTAMSSAVAGDTIVVEEGTYSGDLAQSGDPGNLPNGSGYFWVGNDGTAAHPIVIVAKNPAHPPILQGSTISSGYVIHVTGEYVVLKNLIITQGDKGVVFDNASHGILEDCEIFNSGSELVHVRDASSNVILSRNHLHSSGNGGDGSVGEGFYIGTDQARWGADDVPQSGWGDKAISEGYGGYDWRVENTQVMCNYVSGGVSAECIDNKEGTQFTTVKYNVFVGDSIGLKPGNQIYDDSYIDQKGVKGLFTNNIFYPGANNITKYIAEVNRTFPQVPASLTTDANSSPWCDASAYDGNDCSPQNNIVATSPPADPRSGCSPYFDMNWIALGNGSAALHRISKQQSETVVSQFDLLGRKYHGIK